MISSMLHIRKALWSKLRSSFGQEGRPGKEEVNSLMVTTNVNKEYQEALRTNSYIDIYSKVQSQLETRISLDEGHPLASSSSATMASSPSSPRTKQVHLLEYLVEPRQEILISIFENSEYHQFLGNYFDISLEAGKICEFILQSVYEVRVNYHPTRNVRKLIEQMPDYTSLGYDQYNWLYRNLATFSLHSNPFSTMTLEKFHELHDGQVHLFHQLTSQCKKPKRLALFMMKKWKRGKQESKGKQLEGLRAQFDIAARGVYTMINDFDTMSELVNRLHGEMERMKSEAQNCAMTGKNTTPKEMVRDFQKHEACFQEQLEELEQLIYLSFLNINRSRRLLLQEMDK